MDQMWEIIGVVVAILMVVFGLRLLLKKPQDVHTIQPENIVVDELSQQPITPRHLRESQPVSTGTDVCEAPNFADDKDCDEDIAQNITEIKQDDLAFQEKNNSSEPIQPEIFNKVDPNEYDALVAKLNKEDELIKEAQAVDVTDGVTERDTVIDEINIDVDATTTKDINQAEEITKLEELETEESQLLEKGKIEEWQGESDLLDAHLSQQDRTDEESALATAEHFVALYMYPNPERALSGDRTLKMLLKYGLRFGEMSCFHRYEHPEHESPLMFSVLKITDDGAPIGFDLENMPSEEIKGLAFFLALPNPNSVQGFDMMASIAGLMARDTDGMVFDEQSLELTPQLRDHWRHFVIEYRPQ